MEIMSRQHRKRPNRKCRPHERLWRDYCVDKHLEDEWLESLNALKSFNLISICEGHLHQNLTNRAYPNINLRIKDEYLPFEFSKIDKKLDLFHRCKDEFLAES
jgi:hypothetical protein